MRISHKYKFIWVSKPKTGSTSYRQLLEPHTDISSSSEGEFYHHSSLSSIATVFEKHGWDFSSYLKICPTRNPYDLIVSLYCYSKIDENGVAWWEANEKAYDSEKSMSFECWITSDFCRNKLMQMHRLRNYIYINGNDCADLVFDTNTGAPQFIDFMNSNFGLGINLGDIPQLNITSKDGILMDVVRTAFSNAKINSMVEQIFGYEIERFQYTNPFLKIDKGE
jgi:hypothetical protein